MSVVIRGMKMPRKCSECDVCGSYGIGNHICMITAKNVADDDGLKIRRDDCPLIAVPPHGRLIDADALMENAQYKGTHDIVTAWDIVAAPTVIEAEGE